MEESKEQVAGITFNHLYAISYLLYFYEQYLWKFTAPSVKRTRQITEIQLLLVKIPLLAMSKISAFTPAEIGYIDEAIRVFITRAKEKIPPSESRDAILESCEELHGYLTKTLIPPKTSEE